jgi:Tfp pilus assembly protein PilF
MRALGHQKTAVHCLERASEAVDEDSATIETLTNLHEGNRRGAASLLERDGSFRGAVLRGTLAAEAGDWSTALDHLREAAETRPEAALAWNAAGATELRRGNYFNALQTLDQTPRSAYELGVTWNNRGVALYRLGKLREARAAFERAIELEPEVADWWVNLGVVSLKTKSWAKAEKALKRAAELDPSWPTPLAELAELRRRKGDRKGAKRWQSKASKLRRRLTQTA